MADNDGTSKSQSDKKSVLGPLLDEMIQHRNLICSENALNVDHGHCIGCLLVMKYMQDNFPTMQYGTIEQWAEESAYCSRHEREIFADFLLQRGLGGSKQ